LDTPNAIHIIIPSTSQSIENERRAQWLNPVYRIDTNEVAFANGAQRERRPAASVRYERGWLSARATASCKA
jgi:hypothetical protein